VTRYVFADIETRSRVPIKHGTAAYAASCEILLAGSLDSSGEARIVSDCVCEYVESLLAYDYVVFHNAFFDYAVLASKLTNNLADALAAKTLCSATFARYLSLPNSLAPLSAYVRRMLGNDAVAKSDDGKRLIKLYCVPQRNGGFRELAGDDLQDFISYLRDDLRATRDAWNYMLTRSTYPHAAWRADFAMNRRGVRYDTDAVARIVSRVAQLRATADARLVELTGFRATQNAKLAAHLGMPSLDRQSVSDAIARGAEGSAQEVLTVRQSIAFAALAKYSALQKSAPDGVFRYGFRLFGASRTGRHASTGVQLQNLKRVGSADLDAIRIDIENANAEQLSAFVRGVFYAGCVGDYRNIEARIARWLCDDAAVLDLFREQDAGGMEVYTELGARYGLDRQGGKITELALGYGGGVNALLTYAKMYNATFDDPESVVNTWRRMNPLVCGMWYAIERAFRAALLSKPSTSVIKVGSYLTVIADRGDTVGIKLPSGRILRYYGVRFDAGENRISYIDYGRNGARVETYGAKLFENVCQALVADILNDALARAERAGFEPVMVVHDEIVCAQRDAEALKSVMQTAPGWLVSFPLAAKTHNLTEYYA
jgi:DNA polymerase